MGGGPGFSASGISVRQTATAYDVVKAVRQMIAGQWAELERVAKDAALVVREVLALQCIAAASSKSHRAFDAVIIVAFRRIIKGETLSQMHLSRSSIFRLGRCKADFDKAAVQIFKRELSDEHRTLLFEAYNAAGDGVAAKGVESRRAPKTSKSGQQPKDMSPMKVVCGSMLDQCRGGYISTWMQSNVGMQSMPRHCDACGVADWTCSQNKCHGLWCERCGDEY